MALASVCSLALVDASRSLRNRGPSQRRSGRSHPLWIRSDPETERLTMEVFGRNRIERLLECTFIEVMEISTKTNIFRCDARSRRRAHPEASSQTSRVSSNRYSNFNAFLITITATASAKYYSDESKIG